MALDHRPPDARPREKRLDTQLPQQRMEEMFCGSLNQTAVYPREIVKRALKLGASHRILAHNHPSGVAAQSLTISMAERGLQ